MNIGYVELHLYVQCPECSEDIDLVRADECGEVAAKICTNKWDKLIGYKVACPSCSTEFKLDEVEY